MKAIIRMNRHSLRRLIVCLVFLTGALAMTGCDQELTKTAEDEKEKEKEEEPNHNIGSDDAGHGPNADITLAEPGTMAGSWRIENGEDNALIANMDLVHIEGRSEVEGYFTMRSGLTQAVDGAQGDLYDSSNIAGDDLVLEWNPTDVDDEIYTIEAERLDEDTFTGRLTAIDYEELDKDVVIKREGHDQGD